MKLNLSPSCINLYYQSPLQFYYTYITKELPDMETCDVYSIAGNLIHSLLEIYIHTMNKDDTLKFFLSEWNDKQLNKKLDIKGQILDKESYKQALLNGIKIVNELPKPVSAEEKITIKLYNEYNAKGVIDVVYGTNIIDWKTSNNVDTGENFKRQGLHYAYLIYKNKGIIPDKVIFHYLKINEKKEYKFIEQDILEYEQFLFEFAKMIDKKGNNINEYELGDFNNIFNNHIFKCKDEAARRKNNIKLIIKGANIFLDNPQISLVQQLIKEFSYEMKDAFWIKKSMLKKGVKDYQAVVRFYNVKYNSLPIGFLNRLKKWLMEHNYTINIIDERTPLKDYDMPDKLLDRKLRDYQIETVDHIMKEHICFTQLPTGSGKTTIAAEVIRQNKGLTLFVVDRNVLLTQTAKEFKSMLGKDIGTITEGKMNIREINIATIQTLNSLIKMKNPQLIKLLSNIKTLIIDEGHTCATTSFMRLSKYVTNATIRLGLSASYKREDSNEMQIEACVGYPNFQITVTELINKAVIMKPSIYFFKYYNPTDNVNKDYHMAYDDKITFNVGRNAIIVKLVHKFKDKNILIIVSKIEHGKLLQSQITGSEFIHGDVKADKREEWLNNMKKEGKKVIIGTASIIGKGIDIKNLDVMINATGNLSCITTIQSLGRVLRNSDGKTKAYFFDFYDTGIYFREHCEQRMQTLQKQGHQVNIQ